MTSGLSVSSLSTRWKLYRVLHQQGDEDETTAEENTRKTYERELTTELLAQEDPTLDFNLIRW